MTASQDLPSLAPEQPQHAPAVAALVERAFGPGRYAKAAERLREGNLPLLDLSPVAFKNGQLAGSVRMWRIRIGETAAILLGPIVVDERLRSRGLGAALVTWSCAAAAAAGHKLVLLVGDEPFFGPLSFSIVPAGRIIMPGPVDPRRVMWRALAPGAADHAAGAVAPAAQDRKELRP